MRSTPWEEPYSEPLSVLGRCSASVGSDNRPPLLCPLRDAVEVEAVLHGSQQMFVVVSGDHLEHAAPAVRVGGATRHDGGHPVLEVVPQDVGDLHNRPDLGDPVSGRARHQPFVYAWRVTPMSAAVSALESASVAMAARSGDAQRCPNSNSATAPVNHTKRCASMLPRGLGIAVPDRRTGPGSGPQET